jgi:hypothetical protein
VHARTLTQTNIDKKQLICIYLLYYTTKLFVQIMNQKQKFFCFSPFFSLFYVRVYNWYDTLIQPWFIVIFFTNSYID